MIIDPKTNLPAGQTDGRPDPKRPKAGAWIRTGTHMISDPAMPAMGSAEVYDHPSGMRVLSSVDHVWIDAERHQLEYHVSISCAGRRATRAQVDQALRDFGMRKGFEDNHVPGGIARNFWLPVNPADPTGCHCELDEKPHDEGEGYVWRETKPEVMR